MPFFGAPSLGSEGTGFFGLSGEIKPPEPPHPDSPVITSESVSGTRGEPFSHQITATTTGSPITSYAATNLPAGLSVDPSTGLISGTPTVAVSDRSVRVRATNAEGTGSGTLRMTILAPGIGPGPGPTPIEITDISSEVRLSLSGSPPAGPHDAGTLWMQSNTSELQIWLTPPGMFVPVQGSAT